MKRTLTEIANSKTSPTTGPIDKGTIHNARHSYTYFYDQLFSSLRDEPILMLEIGVCGGGSLKLWYEYFPKATIIGLDINEEFELSNDRTHVFQLDQSNEKELENFVNQCNENGYKFDIIIDDGSHHVEDQQMTLAYLFPLLKSKGIYVIEDLHTSLADNGFPLYGKNLNIQENRKNTTLFYLMESLNNMYATKEQNDYLNDNIETITIHNRFNPYQELQYKKRSITSAIIKK
jgi:2-polyprenyl-3-methyl-5-hydroxy-6-metoxy-1,4-benzoquinol methylase